MLVLAGVMTFPARGDPADDPSTVVVIGAIEPETALAAAVREVPRHWRVETLAPRAVSPGTSHDELEALARSYREADFLRCLTRVEKALDPEDLLQRGRRAEAAQAGTLAAACALGAGDEERARDLLRRLSVRDLVEPSLLPGTTPAFQRLADEERQAAHRRGWIAVDVRSEPDGASIQVNGVERCATAPCRVHLLRGEHVLTAEKLGHRSRTVTPVLEGDRAVTIKLDPASAEETRRQLATALGTGADPSGVEIPRAAASAYGAGLLVLVWARNWQVHAAAYEASSATLTHVAVEGHHATPRAVAAALHGWRDTNGTRARTPADRVSISMSRELILWAMGVVVVLASVVLAFRAHRSRQTRVGSGRALLAPNHRGGFGTLEGPDSNRQSVAFR
ncbi:MAG TPA: PEGA domain-containing protein [Polyangia bacterium]|jgi:hypothetical protein|nr:PEGA domain-containing protein [Polyangia bacterium]